MRCLWCEVKIIEEPFILDVKGNDLAFCTEECLRAWHDNDIGVHSLKSKDQKSYTQADTVGTCGMCKVWPCRSRFNVLCEKCIDKVNAQIKQQIRVFGPIVGSE